MMYQKTLVTRFSGKEFFTPRGYEHRPDEEGIETLSQFSHFHAFGVRTQT